jgi:hypothetical protein
MARGDTVGIAVTGATLTAREHATATNAAARVP